MLTGVPDELQSVAEDPIAYAPVVEGWERLLDRRFALLLAPGGALPEAARVGRLRLREREVAEAVDEIQNVLRARGRSSSVWTVGPSTTPSRLVERLLALGLKRHGEEVGVVLLDAPVGAESGAVVRPVRTLDEYRLAVEILCEGFGLTGEQRAEKLDRVGDDFEALRRSGEMEAFVAYLDGEPVGQAVSAYTPHGALLWGGSTLPGARGRGAYRALVAARWEAAVRRGVPALITSAGPMSRPILLRLGFQAVAEVTQLLDERPS